MKCEKKGNLVNRQVTVGQEDLEQINRLTRREFSQEELYCFRVVLCDNDVDRQMERFDEETLEQLARMFVGKTGICDHQPKTANQLARIYQAQVEYFPGKTNLLGEPYCAVVAKAYMVRTESNRDLILEIEAGIKKEVSVGCSIRESRCSICQSERTLQDCGHDAMIKKFGYKNIMEVPKLDKVVINMGVGEAKDNAKLLESAIADMEKIAGQKAVVTRAKNSVANFKIREGMPIGCKVTLRGEKMYEFVDRLINLALPRVRDFRGVNPNAFDGRGNYALGIKEQLIFPEIEYDKIDKVRGMDVIFVTTAKTDEEARELLTQFNMPFAK